MCAAVEEGATAEVAGIFFPNFDFSKHPVDVAPGAVAPSAGSYCAGIACHVVPAGMVAPVEGAFFPGGNYDQEPMMVERGAVAPAGGGGFCTFRDEPAPSDDDDECGHAEKGAKSPSAGIFFPGYKMTEPPMDVPAAGAEAPEAGLFCAHIICHAVEKGATAPKPGAFFSGGDFTSKKHEVGLGMVAPHAGQFCTFRDRPGLKSAPSLLGLRALHL